MQINLIFDSPEIRSREQAIEFLLSKGKLPRIIYCEKCRSEMNFINSKHHHEGGYYICYKRTCKTKMSLFKNTFFSEPKVEVHLFLRVILGYCIYLDYFQLEIFPNLSRNTIIKIRKKITGLLKPLFSASITCDKTVAKIGEPETYV
ncbi:hypothetical protein CDIK_2279 [Cucumispora dikerogammari]|nr:hypothetical protein CDIK_2279 [Cucumispora dikerogammari]